MRDALTVSNAQGLSEVCDDRFGRSSTIIALQILVAELYIRLLHPALADSILDRLVHNDYRFSLHSESQRKLRPIRTMFNT
jgi:hypothetical protein